MFNVVIDVLVALLGVHALVKFAFFFVLPYAKRRGALDRAYGDKPSATRTADAVLLTAVIVIAGLILWRGIDPVSFLAGLWIGVSFIQLYFHRFHEPLLPSQMPPAIVSPIKMMSYAIQAAPSRSWREMLLMAALIVWALVLIGERYI
jgi:hypothetical protein